MGYGDMCVWEGGVREMGYVCVLFFFFWGGGVFDAGKEDKSDTFFSYFLFRPEYKRE